MRNSFFYEDFSAKFLENEIGRNFTYFNSLRIIGPAVDNNIFIKASTTIGMTTLNLNKLCTAYYGPGTARGSTHKISVVIIIITMQYAFQNNNRRQYF